MPKFDVRRIAKGDGSESVVRVEAADAADAQRAAMDDLYLIGNATPAAEAPPTRPEPSGTLQRLRICGALVLVFGVLTVVFAIHRDTTTSADLGRSVHNLGLLQQQTVSLAVGLAMSLAGWLTVVIVQCVDVVCRVLARVS